jgi:hypothetical protein
MNTRIRRIAAAASIALLASTALAPLASAHDSRARHHHSRSHSRGNDNTGLIVGLGIAALIGTAIIASQSQAQPTFSQPAPAYYPPPQPYYQGGYQQPAYSQPAYVAQPTCTTINDIPACLDRYGNWQYLR